MEKVRAASAQVHPLTIIGSARFSNKLPARQPRIAKSVSVIPIKTNNPLERGDTVASSPVVGLFSEPAVHLPADHFSGLAAFLGRTTHGRSDFGEIADSFPRPFRFQSRA